ncbi:MAG: hypothetical protein JSU95_04630 [Betaproteobacteria bacterium]|nr:MAG: hypothetical protein JSU95_04630 [Betaproteobacteria bacterium]
MFTRITIALLTWTMSLSAHAAGEWVALADSNSDTTFVNRSAINRDGQTVDVQVLRNFAETVTLGNDPETGTPMYPHRSVTLTYKVDCDANRLAVSEWQMFDGNLATGGLVWDQKNGADLGFIPAVNAEMYAVMRSACATNTVLR